MAVNQIDLALDEDGAFQKLIGGLKHAIEAATEIGVYQSNDAWSRVAINLETILQTSMKLRDQAATKHVRGINLR